MGDGVCVVNLNSYLNTMFPSVCGYHNFSAYAREGICLNEPEAHEHGEVTERDLYRAERRWTALAIMPPVRKPLIGLNLPRGCNACGRPDDAHVEHTGGGGHNGH